MLELFFLRLIVSLKSACALEKRSVKNLRCNELCAASCLLPIVFFYLRLCFQTMWVEMFTVGSCINVYTLFHCTKSMFQKQRREDANECILARSLAWHHSEFQKARTHSHFIVQYLSCFYRRTQWDFATLVGNILIRISNKLSLIMRLNAFLRSMK